MDNQTIDAGIQSARDGLMSSIGNKTDWSVFKDDSAPSTPSATENATLNTKSEETRGASEGTETSTNPNDKPQSQQDEGINKQSESVANQADNNTNQAKQQAKPSRENARIRELVEKEKAAQAKAAALERQLQEAKSTQPKAEAKPAEKPVLIDKPALSTEFLQKEYAKYEQAEAEAILAQDKNGLLQARAYQREIAKLIKDNESWDSRNEAAIKDYNSKANFYREAALKEMDSLKDPASPLTQEYMGVRGWINQNFPALLKEPVAEYFLAKVADWKLTSARLATVQAELKTKSEELEKLKKGTLPITPNSKAELGGNNSSEVTIGDARRGLREAIRSANVGMTM